MRYVCIYFIDNQFFQQGFLPIRNSYSSVTLEYGSFNRADCLHLQCKNWIIDELNFLQAFKRTMTNHKRQFSTHFEFTSFYPQPYNTVFKLKEREEEKLYLTQHM